MGDVILPNLARKSFPLFLQGLDSGRRHVPRLQLGILRTSKVTFWTLPQNCIKVEWTPEESS